jgi:hypothetical protein
MQTTKKIKNDLLGYSLLELMIGSGVFAIIAVAISASTALSSQMAVSNIYRNTAYTVAQGYSEQIKSIVFAEIKAALEDPANNNIPTVSLSKGAGTVSELSDPLTFGVRTEKTIVVDIEEQADGTERDRTMQMWVTPLGLDLSTTAADMDAIEITLDFEWKLSDQSITEIERGNLKIVKTAVNEY